MTRVRFAYDALPTLPDDPPFPEREDRSTVIMVPGAENSATVKIDAAYVKPENIAYFNAAGKGAKRLLFTL